MATLLPQPVFKWFKDAGTPASGWKVHTYEPGTTTNKATYDDATESTTNANPVVLNSRGEADIFFSGAYKLVIKDDTDVTQDTIDNYSSSTSTSNVDAGNLAINGSFARDDDGDTTADGWVEVEQTGGTVSLDSSTQTHGAQSVKMLSAGTGGGTYTSSNFIEVNENTTYIIRSSIKTGATVNAANKIQIIWYDSAQTSISTTDYLNDTTVRSSWAELSYKVTPVATARYAKIVLTGVDTSGASGAETAWFDNVWLEFLSSAPINSAHLGHVRKNAIINGDFRVAQRGTSFVSAANNDDVYTLDRWNLLSDGNDIVDVTQTTDASTGALNSIGLDVETASKKFGILQVIEQKNCAHMIGGTVSISFDAKVTSAAAGRLDNIKAVVLSWDSTADTVTSDVVSAWGAEDTTPTWATNWAAENTPANLGVTTSWATYKIEGISVDTASSTNIALFIWADGLSGTVTDFLYVTKVQLELGSTTTDYEFLDYATVFNQSQRYYEVHGGVSGGFPALSTYVAAAGELAYGISFATEKRVAPTITKNGTWLATNCDQPALAGPSVNGYYFYVTASGSALTLTRPNSSDDTITAVCEL